MINRLKDGAAIVGVGFSDFSEKSGVSPLYLGIQAARKAMEDAGIGPKDIDGISTFAWYDPLRGRDLGDALGLTTHGRRTVEITLKAGLTSPPILCGIAAGWVVSGQANYVLVFRAANTASKFGMGSYMGADKRGREFAEADKQWESPFGIDYDLGPPAHYAMLTKEYMEKYGLTSEDMGEVVLLHRRHAALNPRAFLRNKPLTMKEYLDTPWVVYPLRKVDLSAMVDGAIALIITTAERAKDLKQPPVYISAVAGATGHTDPWPAGRSWATDTGPKVLQLAGLGSIKDIDVACLCGCYPWTVPIQLEDFGWCKPGEGPAFIREGKATFGGEIVVNPHGGELAEGYLHAMGHVAEAVIQLRGQAGKRQVKNARVALASGFLGCNAVILRR